MSPLELLAVLTERAAADRSLVLTGMESTRLLGCRGELLSVNATGGRNVLFNAKQVKRMLRRWDDEFLASTQLGKEQRG
jgi:hypothetical protein